jgi:ribosomal protein S20
MPNTKSAKKAARSSKNKNAHNLTWKKRVKEAVKSLKKSIEAKEEKKILDEKLTVLQKVLDKSSKEKVIHRNKANRVKSMYAHKIALVSKPGTKAKSAKSSGK